MSSSPPLGRPSTLTEEITNLICEALTSGNTRKDACAYAGVNYDAFRTWVTKGNRGQEPYAAFTARLKKAEADAVIRNVEVIRDAAKTTWQAAAWWLERKFPDRWSRDATLIRRLEKQIAELEKACRERIGEDSKTGEVPTE